MFIVRLGKTKAKVFKLGSEADSTREVTLFLHALEHIRITLILYITSFIIDKRHL